MKYIYNKETKKFSCFSNQDDKITFVAKVYPDRNDLADSLRIVEENNPPKHGCYWIGTLTKSEYDELKKDFNNNMKGSPSTGYGCDINIVKKHCPSLKFVDADEAEYLHRPNKKRY